MTINRPKTTGGTLMAVDALARPLPSGENVPSRRTDRRVGLFYFLWLGEHGRHKPYDISKMIAEDPMIGYKTDSDKWGGIGVYHHWGEPFYGYYYSDDEWVIRRHIKLFIQAEIDFLFFDTTNAVIYENNAKTVMRVLQEYHDEGWRIPQVMFYTNTHSGDTVERLMEAIYRPGYCRDTWFCLGEKPVIIADPRDCSEAARNFFDIKLSQWPNEADKAGGWPWMDFTRPQRVFSNQNGEPETINVSVAQHPQLRFGDSALYGETGNCGRAFHNGTNDPAPDAYLYGYNFAKQFEHAIETDPPIVLVTGWNEWIAGHWQGIPERPIMFVDCANTEYSRDIEMMRGGYFDNYFMQLVGYVRRYKGTEGDTIHPASAHAEGECAVYDSFRDGAMPRCAEGYGGKIYENRTQRNVIFQLCVRHDDNYLYIEARTVAPITPYDGHGAWMRLYLNTEGGQGYQYVVNSRPMSEKKCTIARVVGEGDNLESVDMESASGEMSVNGDRIAWMIPREVIGLDHERFTVWFKVADSTEDYRTIADFYDLGNAAPLGRLNYVYCGVDCHK